VLLLSQQQLGIKAPFADDFSAASAKLKAIMGGCTVLIGGRVKTTENKARQTDAKAIQCPQLEIDLAFSPTFRRIIRNTSSCSFKYQSTFYATQASCRHFYI